MVILSTYMFYNHNLFISYFLFSACRILSSQEQIAKSQPFPLASAVIPELLRLGAAVLCHVSQPFPLASVVIPELLRLGPREILSWEQLYSTCMSFTQILL